jgi:hypothetical protein
MEKVTVPLRCIKCDSNSLSVDGDLDHNPERAVTCNDCGAVATFSALEAHAVNDFVQLRQEDLDDMVEDIFGDMPGVTVTR